VGKYFFFKKEVNLAPKMMILKPKMMFFELFYDIKKYIIVFIFCE